MATSKKTVKTDTTEKRTTTKKTKKKVESTGVVDEFLDTVVGETFTEEPKKEDNAKKTTKKKKTEKETLDEFAQQSENGTLSLPKEEKKKKTTSKKKTTPKTKKTDENKLIDAEAELNEILSQQITEENIRVADEIEKTINEQKETSNNEPIMGTYLPVEDVETIVNGIDSKYADKEVNPEYYSEFNIESVNEAVKVILEEKTPEEKWRDLGLTSEAQEDIKNVVSEMLDETKNVVYPKVEEKKAEVGKEEDEKEEPKQPILNVENLRVDFSKQNNAQPTKITYVTTSMGVSYD